MSARTPTARPVGQSMALLTELMDHPLDRSYQDRADARRARGEAASTGSRSVLLLLACILLGLLLVVAAQTLRVPQERASGQKAQIIGQIESGQRLSDRLARDNRRLQSEISTLQAGSGTGTTSEQLRRTEVMAGAVAVTGPGVTLTLDDRRGAAQQGPGPRDGGREQDTLTSTDLQVIVNGLWQAGAEAIGINGHRLTSLSAIRFAGAAILVDYRPLARPYVITAVGAPGLWEAFRTGSGGTYLDSIKEQLPLDVRADSSGTVRLPAAEAVDLHAARPSAPGEPPTRPRTEAP